MKKGERFTGFLPSMMAPLLMVVAAAASTPAQAAGRDPKFSTWKFASYTAPSGRFYCSMLSAVDNKSVGQNIIIKGSPSINNLVIDLYRDKWNRPQGQTVKVMFDFADNQPLTLPAYTDAHILDVQLPTEITAAFLLELAEKPVLQVIFPDDDEDSWVVAGGGSARKAVEQMISCLGGGK